MRPLLAGFSNWIGKGRSFNLKLLAVIVTLMISYTAAFPFLFQLFGPAIRLFCIAFIFPVSIFWGVRGGLVVAALTFLLNFMLHHHIGYEFEGGVIGPIALIAAVLTLGRLSDLHRKLKQGLQDRVETEKELRDSEEKYRRIFEMESDGIALIDAETGQILEINQAAIDLFQYSREEALQLNAVDVSAEPEKTLASIKDRNEKVPIRYMRKKDGTIFSAELLLTFFELQGRQVFNIVIRDISERIDAEKEKLSIERQLQRAHRMEAIGTLAGGIAHDFNNILSAIMGYAELMQIQNTNQDEKWRSHLEQIQMASSRAKNLVHQILAFSRQTDTSKKPIAVKPIVKEALQLLRAAIPANIEINQKISAEEDTVNADPVQIHQVIMNLCTNASQAMAEKGGEMEIGLSNVHLNADIAFKHLGLEPGDYLEIAVKDIGYGIAPEVMENIFNPYFTTKQLGEGTGLGLSVVHGIVKKHQGSMMVDSTVGKGSTFKVYLPLAHEGAEVVEVSASKIQTGTERILVVDDEPAILDIYSEMLNFLGYRTESRTSSLEALSLFTAKPDYFDVVITDMAMPNMTGTELAEKITRVAPGFPIIMSTGYSTRIDKEKIEAIGIKGFLMKPVVMAELSREIRRVLDETESQGG